VLLVIIVALGGLLFMPGVSGPYLFDDYSNLIENTYIQLTAIDAESLYRSGFSLAMGPTHRPVAMVSFALNYYFAGSFDSSTPFKLVNILIHLSNGLLMFWLARLMLRRYLEIRGASAARRSLITPRTYTYVAAAVALLWVTHPIQVSSVLYLVQRMTSLSALFTLLALICYIVGRSRLATHRPHGVILIFLGVPLFGALGIFSKEIAALLPVFILVFEVTLFRSEWPWNRWNGLSRNTKYLLGIAGVVAAAILLVAALGYAIPKYAQRNFTMIERLMTEGRVVTYYLSLILVPRINEFSLFHDEFGISRTLTTPWTTVPAMVGLLALAVLAIRTRRTSPLLSFGILWFFASHLLESTIFPLEIIHEHRNYLATLGPLVVVVHFIDRGSVRMGHNRLWILLPIMIVVFSTITLMRADQWSSFHNFFNYEVTHNPNSATTHAGMSIVLLDQGKHDEAIQEMRRAAELKPEEASYLLVAHMFAARAGKQLDEEDYRETSRRLAKGHFTPTTGQALQHLGDCILSWCRSLDKSFEDWLRVLIARSNSPTRDLSHLDYLLARTLLSQERFAEAVDAYKASHKEDPNYLHALLELAYLYIRLDEPALAQETLIRLREVNQTALHPRPREIEQLQRDVDELKQRPAKPKR
jgi:hypothetical protein